MATLAYPALDQIQQAAARLRPHIARTPIHRWQTRETSALFGGETELWLKLELFQRAGSFKARGALLSLLALDAAERQRGVTAVSAGNHAVAVSYAAHTLGLDAKLVMQASADPVRIAEAGAYGAEILLAESGLAGFALAEKIAREEGRAFIHPFEGPHVALGSASLGLELHEQIGDCDHVLVAVGGGGLAGGLACAIKALNPDCAVHGVEPVGADAMSRSMASGAPVALDRVDTIADSLAPPMTLPYSFALCRDHLDSLVTIDDQAICEAAALLFRDMKLAVEPAAAAATAAALGPLRQTIEGQRVAIIVCGANIGFPRFSEMMARAGEAVSR